MGPYVLHFNVAAQPRRSHVLAQGLLCQCELRPRRNAKSMLAVGAHQDGEAGRDRHGGHTRPHKCSKLACRIGLAHRAKVLRGRFVATHRGKGFPKTLPLPLDLHRHGKGPSSGQGHNRPRPTKQATTIREEARLDAHLFITSYFHSHRLRQNGVRVKLQLPDRVRLATEDRTQVTHIHSTVRFELHLQFSRQLVGQIV